MGATATTLESVKAQLPRAYPSASLACIRDLTVSYRTNGQAHTILDGISLDISHGTIVGLLGESGCGKTTTALSLLRLLPGNAKVIRGSVCFDGRNLLLLNKAELCEMRGAEISIIYQDSSVLNPVLRVGVQVSDVLRAHRRCSKRQAREEVEAVFTDLGFHEPGRIFDAYPHQLSGGQRRRIAIAQAVICQPRLVIADEPTSSVDPQTTAQILEYFRRLRESSGTAFLFISHDPATLAAIADELLVMYAGQIVESGPIYEVCARPAHPYTQALLRCAPQWLAPNESRSRHLPFIPGAAPEQLDTLMGCAFADRCSDRMGHCSMKQPGCMEISDGRSVRCFKYEVQ